MPIRRGIAGSGFLRAGSNNPSAASLAFNCSNATCSAPAPTVHLVSVAFDANVVSIEGRINRSDLLGFLSAHVTFSINGSPYALTVNIADGTADGLASMPIPAGLTGFETIDAAIITAVTPNTYAIQP